MSGSSRQSGAMPRVWRPTRMAIVLRRAFGVGLWLLTVGCESASHDQASDRSLVLTETRLRLPAALRERIVRESSISDAEVRSRVEGGRLVRNIAERGGLDLGRLSATRRAVLARAMLEQLMLEQRSLGPARDDELDREVQRRWVLWDRPRGVVVMHALARIKKPADDPQARAVAERLSELLRDVSDPTEFEARVRGLPEQPVEVVVERLPPITEDGRSFELTASDRAGSEGPRMDSAFAKAAHRLTHVGARSSVVRSPFGYHLILLIEIVPPLQKSREEQRAQLTETVVNERFRGRLSQLLQVAKETRSVHIERNVAELTARLQVTE